MTVPYAEPWTIRPLSDPVIPEPPRSGDPGGPPCEVCEPHPDRIVVWADERWHLVAARETPIPGLCLLMPNRHVDGIADLDETELAELGPLCAKVSRALYARGDVGRVVVSTFGDGTAHLHVWFAPRPLGALDLRGSFLWNWLDHLPPLSPETVREAADDLRERLSG